MDDTPSKPGPASDSAPEAQADATASSVTSRRMLMLGAVGASTVIAVRPALAQTTASVLNCQIPVPGPGDAGKYIDRNGNVVNPGPLGPLGALFGGPYPPPSRPFTGEEVRNALYKGMSLPGTTYYSNDAYLKYIRKLSGGQSGYTCFLSVQNPRT
ncbi:hypothetical protein BSZ14_09805 [Sphingomonas sp. Sph1(2015)]|uniref:hypothetical protein n=1 Tax=Sphingomonas sp. Sph1(2015) TaxID=1628084 RepID=UPI000975EA4E|nr:hypothetical protein [Sphingomonas sp. Sph1(2015)]OMJ32187.1 hypothetical protein BSZ14_09805 [Sphingomonas sp. Sph1(2015)]